MFHRNVRIARFISKETAIIWSFRILPCYQWFEEVSEYLNWRKRTGFHWGVVENFWRATFNWQAHIPAHWNTKGTFWEHFGDPNVNFLWFMIMISKAECFNFKLSAACSREIHLFCLDFWRKIGSSAVLCSYQRLSEASWIPQKHGVLNIHCFEYNRYNNLSE